MMKIILMSAHETLEFGVREHAELYVFKAKNP